MESDLLAACARLASELQHFYPLIRTVSILAGFVFLGAALVQLKASGEERRSSWPGLCALLVAGLMLSLTTVMDALTMSLFRTSAPADLASVSVGSAGGLEPMIRLAVTIVMVVGAYQIVKGLVMLRESASRAHVFWSAITHIVGGILCLNIRTFVLALGSTMGGSVEEVARVLLGD